MAEKHINLTLGSTADTSGFQTMGKAVDNLGKNVQKASSGLSQIAGELGGLNGTVGKVAGGLSGLFSSFAGGPIGVAIAGLTMIVSLMVKWKNHTDEVKEKQRELTEKMRDGYANRITTAIEEARKKQETFLDTLINKGKSAIERMEKLRSSMRELGRSEDNLNNARTTDREMSNIRYQTAQRVYGASTPQEAEIIKAEGSVREVEVKGKQEWDKHFRTVSEYNEDMRVSKEKIETLNTQKQQESQKCDELIKSYEKQIETNNLLSYRSKKESEYKAKNAELETEIIKARQRRDEKLEKLDNDISNENIKLKTTQNNLAAAEEKLQNTMTDNATEMTNARDAVKKAREAQQKKIADDKKAAEKERAAKAKEDENKRIDNVNRSLKKQAEADIEAQRKGTKKLVSQLDAQIKSIEEFKNNFDTKVQRGMRREAAQHSGLFGGYHFGMGEDGIINNVADLQRSRRYDHARGQEARDLHRAKADENREKRLREELKHGRELSKRDKQFLKDREEIKKRQNADKALKELQEKKDKAVLKMNDNIEVIKKNLDAALLVK